jgi:hypothetical protein
LKSISTAPFLLLALALPALCYSQMNMGQMGHMEGMGQQHQHAPTFVQTIEAHTTSGTSVEPNSTPAPMLMTERGKWMLMFHANTFIVDTQQSGPRGQDKFFSTNWLMPMAQRDLGPGHLTLRAMLSLEPATVTRRRYPLLFQLGETAYGRPIVDGQHPHNFLMELGALYDWRLGGNTLLSFYAAPVGDPAIGPTAYPHRASAMEDPLAALGHHQEDSTHIADDVVTVGITHGIARIEASGFHGREPNEHRWQVQQGAIDSWSTRFTLQPGQNWSGQYSYAFIHSPEALFPAENQRRMTASIMYNRPFHDSTKGNWTSSLVWGRTRTGDHNLIQNSYLLESLVRFAMRNNAYTRIENVDRTTELLLDDQPLPPGFDEEPAGRVQAYTFGYNRDFNLVPHLSSALGAQITAYTPGARLKPVYGSNPAGVAIYLRLRPLGHHGH